MYLPDEDVVITKQHFDMLNYVYPLLLRKPGIILIENVSLNDKCALKEIVHYKDDVKAFGVYYGDEIDIAIRHYRPAQGYMIKRYFSSVKKLYEEEKYSECLSVLFKLVTSGKPTPYVFKYIAQCYLKLDNPKNAFSFFKIAYSEFNKLGVEDTECLDFLNNYNSENEQENVSSVKVNLSKYVIDCDDIFFGIYDFVEINRYINENKLDVETTCKKLGLTDEDICVVKLVYAKEFYKAGYTDTGDKFIHSVEKTNNKSFMVKHLLDFVRSHKKFYLYKGQDFDISLSLVLKP